MKGDARVEPNHRVINVGVPDGSHQNRVDEDHHGVYKNDPQADQADRVFGKKGYVIPDLAPKEPDALLPDRCFEG